ncbi:hypothetical protein T492DRAFT_893500 [Pavlovales sp. CCMP2436]|nr:hypothetical protein T492DRAFT_893500 [Pavlovales sp. CCMP2436]
MAPAKRRVHKLFLTAKQRRDLQAEANRQREVGAARQADREGQTWFYFESRQLEGQQRLWPMCGIVASSWLYSGQIRAHLFALAGTARNVDARSDGLRRLEPFPWREMYDPGFLDALLAPDGQINWSNFEMLADFCDFSGTGVRALGASRECKSGAINSVVGLTIFVDLHVKIAHENMVGTTASSSRGFSTSLPDQFEQAGKSVNSSMLDVMREIMEQAASARTATPTVAQPQRTQPAADAWLALA